MSRAFNSALKLARTLTNASSSAAHTENEIVYVIPKQTTESIKIKSVDVGDDCLTIVATKLAPVAKSPLDAYRGSGRHSNRQNLLKHQTEHP
jgi:hypothetical protein